LEVNKINKFERAMILIIIILAIILNSFIYIGLKEIKNRGGIRAVIVDTGKEIKNIVKEIDE